MSMDRVVGKRCVRYAGTSHGLTYDLFRYDPPKGRTARMGIASDAYEKKLFEMG